MCGGGTNKRRALDKVTTIPTSHDATALRDMRKSSEREEGLVDPDIDGHGSEGQWGALLHVPGIEQYIFVIH